MVGSVCSLDPAPPYALALDTYCEDMTEDIVEKKDVGKAELENSTRATDNHSAVVQWIDDAIQGANDGLTAFQTAEDHKLALPLILEPLKVAISCPLLTTHQEYTIDVACSEDAGEGILLDQFYPSSRVVSASDLVFQKRCTIDGNSAGIESRMVVPGKERSTARRPSTMSTNRGYIILYNVASRPSFNFIKSLCEKHEAGEDIFNHARELKSELSKAPKILVGFHPDSNKATEVFPEEGQNLARSIGSIFAEVSNLDPLSVQGVFYDLVREIYWWRQDASTTTKEKEQPSGKGTETPSFPLPPRKSEPGWHSAVEMAPDRQFDTARKPEVPERSPESTSNDDMEPEVPDKTSEPPSNIATRPKLVPPSRTAGPFKSFEIGSSSADVEATYTVPPAYRFRAQNNASPWQHGANYDRGDSKGGKREWLKKRAKVFAKASPPPLTPSLMQDYGYLIPNSHADMQEKEYYVEPVVRVGKVSSNVGDVDNRFDEENPWTELNVKLERLDVELDAYSLNPGKKAGKVQERDAPLTDKSSRTALQAVAQDGHIEVVEKPLAAKADVAATSARERYTALQIAIRDGHEDKVQMLLDAGADVDAQNAESDTALQIATTRGHEKIVQMLLDAGANANIPGGRVESHLLPALQIAANEGLETIMRSLLDAGADANIRNNRNNTPLMWAAQYGRVNCLQMLLDTGVVDVNAVDDDGDTALICAASVGKFTTTKILLKRYDVDRDIRNLMGKTAEEMAEQKGHDELSSLFATFDSRRTVGVAF